MRFLVFTDLHYDAVSDGDKRLEELIAAAREKEADFILNLGDTCHPKAENQKIVETIRSCGIPCYMIPGNHDSDIWSEAEVLSFWGLPKAYYSMVRDNVKFLFLNTVELQDGPVIPEEQIAWLQEEMTSDHYFVILTHQSLGNDFVTPDGKSRGIRNRKIIQDILEKNKERVLLCINGHNHGCDVKEINGICYYTLNSASYTWQNGMFLYRQALYCMITVDEDTGSAAIHDNRIPRSVNVTVEGVEGDYLTASPASIGMSSMWNGVRVMPNTLSIEIKK
ncbi:MAG: metallophosphoesterase [Roseburia sp.]|nr:metallophosphoesterase [Roseburia sp.]MCM1097545.1 metallophosphoesterase [Ruminococcus flavefaciens]